MQALLLKLRVLQTSSESLFSLTMVLLSTCRWRKSTKFITKVNFCRISVDIVIYVYWCLHRCSFWRRSLVLFSLALVRLLFRILFTFLHPRSECLGWRNKRLAWFYSGVLGRLSLREWISVKWQVYLCLGLHLYRFFLYSAQCYTLKLDNGFVLNGKEIGNIWACNCA